MDLNTNQNEVADAMSNEGERYELYLCVDSQVDENELDQMRIYLQNELKELDGVVETTQIAAGKAPEGARAVDLVVIGGLALALKQAGVFDAVEQVLKSWIEGGNRRKEKRKVVIKRPDGTVLSFDGYSLKDIVGTTSDDGKT